MRAIPWAVFLVLATVAVAGGGEEDLVSGPYVAEVRCQMEAVSETVADDGSIIVDMAERCTMSDPKLVYDKDGYQILSVCNDLRDCAEHASRPQDICERVWGRGEKVKHVGLDAFQVGPMFYAACRATCKSGKSVLSVCFPSDDPTRKPMPVAFER